MTVTMGEEFKKTIESLPESVRCVVLTGSGRAFSAGGDLDFLEARANDNPHHNTEEMLRFYDRFLVVRKCKVPVLSAIHGPAVGAGLCLAMATDIRVTHKECVLQFPFSALGLHPGMAATFFMPIVAGQEAAFRLLLTGDKVTGEEALKLGLVSCVEEKAEDVVTTALEMAERIAAHPHVGIATTLATLRMHQDAAVGGLKAALVREADAQAACYATPELAQKVADTKAAIASKSKNK
mmetsp:Transcript_2419/g.4559  ORF Transcript_2419/g.4559 Transcript_2419/m.4559 type:complete len:238 (+) Transcript_2419:100-813(+)